MRKPIVAGNWKMHGTRASVVELLSQLKQGLSEYSQSEIVVFPPYVFLDQAQRLLKDSPIDWGGQNVSESLEGALTGEISASMLKEYGCRYVLVGHSERRQLFGETNEQVAEKFILSASQALQPILCVGETLQQREAGSTFDVIKSQLLPLLTHQEGLSHLASGIVAYEPVWAIGTGLTASSDTAQEVHRFIRGEVEKCNKTLAEKLRIIYGGSVKPSNAADLFSMPDIDGGLIGGASLNSKEFLDIAKLCNYYS